YQLAQCENAMSSAFIAEGNWESARRHALEALVSSRRVSSSLQEGIALGNLCIAERGRCRYLASEDAGNESLVAFARAGAHTNIAHSKRSLAITGLKRG